MIPLHTRDSARAIDRDAVERLGLPSIVLMENAGHAATRLILRAFTSHMDRVVIAGGPGMNGGDGWVVARQLHQLSFAPRVVLVGSEEKLRGDAKTNFDAAKKLSIACSHVSAGSLRPLEDALRDATLIVDALFGTGLDRPLSGMHEEVVRMINASTAPRVALDMPSGIDANTGAILGCAVRADLTVTFAGRKRGLYQHPGAAYAGRVVCAGIGVPCATETSASLVTPADVGAAIPPRARDAHKGSAGHVLVIAGSAGRTGAALLAGHAALRAGAGLVTIATQREARASLETKVTELMTELLPGTWQEVLELASNKQAAALGPGFGLDTDARSMAISLAENLALPLVIDADALTAIADGGGLRSLRDAAGPRVLTPHPGEAARLLGCTTQDVQADRYAAAASLAAETGQVAVLKGANTVIATPQGQLYVCARGTPALGVAGTGDVLTGTVAALLATLDSERAAWSAVVLHGLAGELAAASDRGLLAHEVADALPRALERARTSGRRRANAQLQL